MGLASVSRDPITDVEAWLVNDVLPTLEAMKADPSQLLSAEEAWNHLITHMTDKDRSS